MNPFKRPGGHYGRSPAPETPYQRAAQVWDDRIGSARVQARNWRFMAFGCLALSAGSVNTPPAWAQRMKRGQAMSHGVSAAAHAVRSGDSHGSGSSVNLSESDRS